MSPEISANPTSVGIIGGTGPAGRAFAARLASIGLEVWIGSRSIEKAGEAVEKVLKRWPDRDLDISPGTNDQVARADVVVVATPWTAAASTARDCKDDLHGKVVISMANAISMVDGELQSVVPARGSIAASVQAALPDSRVVGAMHHVPAKELGSLDESVDCDVLVCSDHQDALRAVIDMLGRLAGLRPVDAGSLSNAAAVEAFTAVLLGVNARHGVRTTIRLEGLG